MSFYIIVLRVPFVVPPVIKEMELPMYSISVKAESMTNYFYGITVDTIDRRFELIVPVKDFDYVPKHYGIERFINRYDMFLSERDNWDDSEIVEVYDCSTFFLFGEILTFEFETEEEALYFKLKYGSLICIV